MPPLLQFHRELKFLTYQIEQLKGKTMRTRSINYWMSQILAEKEKNSNNIKEPQHDKELNYQVAQYYVNKNSNQTKVA
jgi:hypothetical protein